MTEDFPAFPSNFVTPMVGMSYRQWLAGLAMQGLYQHLEWDSIPQRAFKMADAMIKESEK